MLTGRPGNRFLHALAIAVVVALVAPAAAAACANTSAVPGQANIAAVRGSFLCLLNQERVRYRLRPLVSEAHLVAAAQRHTQDMVARRYFSHTTLSGLPVIPRLLRSGYRRPGGPYEFGEALGYNYGEAAAPARMLAQLLGSPLHRAKLLGARFRNVGIGIAAGLPMPDNGYPGATYTIDVGLRG